MSLEFIDILDLTPWPDRRDLEYPRHTSFSLSDKHPNHLGILGGIKHGTYITFDNKKDIDQLIKFLTKLRKAVPNVRPSK